jgi:RP/EB family microtubule-associated protein
MAKGRFQDNMFFLQWLWTYSRRMGPQHFGYYKGYQRRLEALDKQKREVKEMSPHLIPNQAFFPDR